MKSVLLFSVMDSSGTCISFFCYPCCVTSAPDFQEEAVAVKIQALGDCRRSAAITPCVTLFLFISVKPTMTFSGAGFQRTLKGFVRFPLSGF